MPHTQVGVTGRARELGWTAREGSRALSGQEGAALEKPRQVDELFTASSTCSGPGSKGSHRAARCILLPTCNGLFSSVSEESDSTLSNINVGRPTR